MQLTYKPRMQPQETKLINCELYGCDIGRGKLAYLYIYSFDFQNTFKVESKILTQFLHEFSHTAAGKRNIDHSYKQKT